MVIGITEMATNTQILVSAEVLWVTYDCAAV